MITFAQLDQALDVRSKEWDSELSRGLLFRAIELGGEAGEALNIVKKLVREAEGLVGSKATVRDLENELADVVISAARVAHAARDANGNRINLGKAVRRKFNADSRKHNLKAMMVITDEDDL